MRILILDDEPPAARRLERLLGEALPDQIENLKIYHNLTATLCHLDEHPVDLLFLDIDLEGESGFELLRSHDNGSFAVIVTTGHRDYAVEAFEHRVLDFLPKPFSLERLQQALGRLNKVQQADVRHATRKKLAIRDDDEVELIEIDQIQFITNDKNYSILHLDDDEERRLRRSMDKLQEELPKNFVRVHRSCIVREDQIDRILHAKNNTYKILAKSGAELPLSRKMYATLKAKIGI